MKLTWKKKGLIFKPDGKHKWMYSHAQVPCPIIIDDKCRIFYTCRPEPDEHGNSLSYVSYVDVDRYNLSKILYVHNTPILELGGPGDFDEFGIHPVCLIRNNKEIYFYYQGWERGYSVPYKTSLGLAISNNEGNSFKKKSQGPLFSRAPLEPYLENGFFILKENDTYYMWYATCNEWVNCDGKLEPYYFIVSAESSDGINWVRYPTPLFETAYTKEVNGRPTVIKLNGYYHMWFCYRDIYDFRSGKGGAYRIRYAYSTNLKNWIRDDTKSGISLSDSGWDSQMQAYPYVIEIDKKIYLFYNGNNFGREGFGYAELDCDL